MPNHWESSARPLFVKTVFINGSRHAILFEKDPLLRCVNSPFRKTSRPNSSQSFPSNVSVSSSESQNSDFESKTSKYKNIPRSQNKNLSSELQSCLIKFKLASDSLKIKNKSVEEKCFCDSKINCSGKENSKKKRNKENQENRWKLCKQSYEEQKECKLTDKKDKSCYIYHLEKYNGRKNYCFVKITSQPPQFILNCSCKSDSNETHNPNPHNKNDLIMSASIQNLVMTPNENENMLEKTFDYVLPFDNSELHWNNYLMRSYYNSLAERVLQWIDLAKNRKKPTEKLNLTDVTDSEIITERVYSGKKFANEIKKTQTPSATDNKVSWNKKIGKVLENDTSEEEIVEKVVREHNVETLLSIEKIRKTSQNFLEEKFVGEIAEDKLKQPEKFPTSTDLNASRKSPSPPSTEESNSSIISVIQASLKIQDLLLNSSSKERNSIKHHKINKKKIKEPHNASSQQNRYKGSCQNENKIGSTKTYNPEKENERDVYMEKFDGRNKRPKCFSNDNLNKWEEYENSKIMTDFSKENQKSINNLNLTQTRPVIIQNLSPQQHNKIPPFVDKRILWGSEKNSGRPQLHIFMPNVSLKEQSDDSMSECENFLKL